MQKQLTDKNYEIFSVWWPWYVLRSVNWEFSEDVSPPFPYISLLLSNFTSSQSSLSSFLRIILYFHEHNEAQSLYYSHGLGVDFNRNKVPRFRHQPLPTFNSNRVAFPHSNMLPTIFIFHVSGVVGCEALLWILIVPDFFWWYIINLLLLPVASFCFNYNHINELIRHTTHDPNLEPPVED